MRIRDHEKIKPWPPPDWACVGPTPSIDEIGPLVLENVLVKTPSRLELVVNYRGGDCLSIKDINDANFLSLLSRKLRRYCGLTLKEIGDLEIDF